MELAIKFALLLGSLAVGALLIFCIVFFLRPLATTFWLRRIALYRAGLRKTKLSTSVGQQTVWHIGAGPLLLLLHGAGDQAATWYRVAPELKRHFQLLVPDLAGHGGSEPREGMLSLGTSLTALEELLDSASWRNTNFVIAGNSLGAWLAMLLAQKHPHRVTRAILIDGGPIKNPAELGLMPKNREEARKTFGAILDPSSPRPPNFVLDDLVRVSNSGPISRLLAAAQQGISQYLMEGKLGSLQVPMDLIWGASDRLVPLGFAKKLQSLIPNCTLSIIERCGHAPQLERPHEFTRVLLRLVQSDSDAPVHAGVKPSEGVP